METGTLLRKMIAEGRITDPDTPRGRLLAAAARQFRRKGYANTTVRDLAAEVGILSGSIFHHVKNKEEILYGVMLEVTIALSEAVKASVVEAKDSRSKLRNLIHNELSFLHGSTSDATAVLLTEWRSLSEAHRKTVLKEREVYDRQWEETLDQAKGEGLVQIEPRILRQLLHGALGWSIFWYNADGDLDLEALTDRVMLLASKDG